MIVRTRSRPRRKPLAVSDLRPYLSAVSALLITLFAIASRASALPMHPAPMGYDAAMDGAMPARKESHYPPLLNEDAHLSREARDLSHESASYTLVSPYVSDNTTSTNSSHNLSQNNINGNASNVNATARDLGARHVQQLLLSLRDALRNILVAHNSSRYRRHANVSPSSTPLVGTILGTMETVRSVAYNDSLKTNSSTSGNVSTDYAIANSSSDENDSDTPEITAEASDDAKGSMIVSGLNEAFHKMGEWIQQASDAIRSKFADDKSTFTNSTQEIELNSTAQNNTDGLAQMIFRNSSLIVARVGRGRLVSSSALRVVQEGAFVIVETAEEFGIRKHRIQIEDQHTYSNGSSFTTVDAPHVRLSSVRSSSNDSGYDIIIPLLTLNLEPALRTNQSSTREQVWSAHTEEDNVKFLQAQLECQQKFGASGLRRMLCTCESVHAVSVKRELLCVSRVADKAIRAAQHVGANHIGEEVYDGAADCNKEAKIETKLSCLISVLEENVGRQTKFHAAHGRSILGDARDESVDAILSQWTLTLDDLDGSDRDVEVGTGFGPGGASLWPAHTLMWIALATVLAVTIARIVELCKPKNGQLQRAKKLMRDCVLVFRRCMRQVKMRKQHLQTNLV